MSTFKTYRQHDQMDCGRDSKTFIIMSKTAQLSTFVILCLVLLSGFSKKVNNGPRRISLHFDQTLVIPNKKEKGSIKNFLVKPREVQTDQKGNIYISDPRLSTIKVYDPRGNFLRTIGRRGKGPGEFLGTMAFDITGQNKIMVMDGVNWRVTLLTTKGKVLNAYSPNSDMLWPSEFYQLDKNHIALLRYFKTVSAIAHNKSPKIHTRIFHIYDPAFKHVIASFGNDSLLDLKSAFAKIYTVNKNSGNFCAEGDTYIWYAPGIYRGKIYKFANISGQWQLNKVIDGYSAPPDPVTLTEGNSNMKGILFYKTYGKNKGHYSGRVNSVSLALFRLKDKRLVHFSSQIIDGKRQTIVEIFSKSGKLESIGTLKEFTYPITGFVPIVDIWKDSSGRFYFLVDAKTPKVKIGFIRGL